jgi:hypothetical protein
MCSAAASYCWICDRHQMMLRCLCWQGLLAESVRDMDMYGHNEQFTDGGWSVELYSTQLPWRARTDSRCSSSNCCYG